MDRSRKASRETNEATLQHKSKIETVRIHEIIVDKLAELETSIERMKQSPEGVADLQRRSKLFGECNRIEGETTVEFHDKLRHWLTRLVPQTKLPLHPPRQEGE